MAHLYPENGPAKETTSSAEILIYETLRDRLDNQFQVYHAPVWQVKEENGYISNGEVDFIIVHPEMGVILMEVKGGSISYDGAAGQWISTDVNWQPHNIKDPFKQVNASMYGLRKRLRQTEKLKAFAKEYALSYGIWFPDTYWTPGQVALPHIADEIVLDAKNIHDPLEGLQRIVSYHQKRPPARMSDAALAALAGMLAPTVHVQSTLAAQIDRDAPRIEQLTREQFEKLDQLSRYRRLAVRGSAGTGKTVLAVEKVHRLAAAGLDVLFLCRNSFLARWVERRFSQEPDEIRQHIDTAYLEELCALLATNAGIAYQVGNGDSDEKIASSLKASFDALKAENKVVAYDAILVDEAQDIGRPIWPYLQRLLRDQQDGLLYAFYDPAQSENGLDDDWSPPLGRGKRNKPLTINCRNTRSIFALMQRFYTGLDDPVCLGPEGSPVQFIAPEQCKPRAEFAGDYEKEALAQTLDRLIGEEKVAPEDILIITCRSRMKSRWLHQRQLGRHKLTWQSDKMMPGHVALSLVRSAKGLERKVVILSELDGLEGITRPRRDNLLYIAISRAMFHLIVLGTEDTLTPR